MGGGPSTTGRALEGAPVGRSGPAAGVRPAELHTAAGKAAQDAGLQAKGLEVSKLDQPATGASAPSAAFAPVYAPG